MIASALFGYHYPSRAWSWLPKRSRFHDDVHADPRRSASEIPQGDNGAFGVRTQM